MVTYIVTYQSLTLLLVTAPFIQSLLDGCIIVPKVCPNENITFWLYTRETQNSPLKLDPTNSGTSSAAFNKSAPVKILIHGYTGWKDYSPNTEIRPALFQRGEYNVISVDYNPIALDPCYIQAVENVDVIANCTAQLIDDLVKENVVPFNNIHTIGFSLGAQVAGRIRNFLKSGLLKRVTGLDPAFPLFYDNNPNKILDDGDAEFVDVIHTNAGVKGDPVRLGHLDFYLNGGTSQPGCLLEDVKNVGGCSHARAPAYYAESINSEIGFWGEHCADYLDVLLGCETITNQQLMGEFANPSARGVYSVNTSSQSPFALGMMNRS